MLRSAVFVCLGGCSIALSGPDPARHPRSAPTCDTSKTLVKIDAASAVTFGLIGLGLLSGNQGSAGGGTLVTGALYAAAALRGSNVVDRCRASFDDYDREVMQGPVVVDQDARKLTFPTPRLAAPPVRPPAPPPPPPVEAAAEPETHEAEAAPPAPAPAPAPVPTNQDAFHTTVGQEPPVRAARQVATPAPAMSPWREFWREVP